MNHKKTCVTCKNLSFVIKKASDAKFELKAKMFADSAKEILRQLTFKYLGTHTWHAMPPNIMWLAPRHPLLTIKIWAVSNLFFIRLLYSESRHEHTDTDVLLTGFRGRLKSQVLVIVQPQWSDDQVLRLEISHLKGWFSNRARVRHGP
jgi:hypothetical protein